MVLPNAPNAIRGLVDAMLRPRGVELNVLAEVGAVQTVLALVVQGVGCTIVPESALAMSAQTKHLPHAPIGPPTIWNTLVLAVPLARPATRLTRGTQQLLRELDFRKGPGSV
jgi:LysR family nitrogen assimilation transcriptional regulator